ncbi:alpha/beta fold hydrolase [Sediminicoccus sp. BL-A-41-H5]|uniref:alpha/beta fold hydrolase n=1 Tax=Sediminicoccus sp. BL-A-41-H5 TaxID=3421106 RepID=UPI003D667139
MFFEGFTLETREVDGMAVRYRRGGKGPPLLLLHGNPQTHAMWHRVAPELAERFTVIAADIRGYGFSAKPGVTADHAPYSKREMAKDVVGLMRGLGFDRFRIVSHDRGARLAHRIALDHPACVEKLCVMDIVPTLHHFEHADMKFGLGYYHWFWFAQPHPGPETLISADVEAWFDIHTSREPKDRSFFHPEARADYLAALRLPGTVTAICEDYRAAASIDLEHDRASRAAGVRVQCPVLALWGSKGKIGQWYDALEVWRAYADGPVSGHAVNSGHYLAEEAPGEVLVALEGFLA